MRAELWLRTMYARAWVRVRSIYGEPLWLIVTMAAPLLTSTALALLYKTSGLVALSGFAILGGVMLAFWGNVLWSMASQFHWDKETGLFEIYLISPAPMSALLVGMSIGGIAGTAPSAFIVAISGWFLFSPAFNPSWESVALTFILTLIALYAMGMLMSSMYLAYGREAEALNEAIQEPVSMISGLYFPSIGKASPFPLAVQAIASLIPLTIGMDALRKAAFESAGPAAVLHNLLALSLMAIALMVAAVKALDSLEERGRKFGTLVVRLK